MAITKKIKYFLKTGKEISNEELELIKNEEWEEKSSVEIESGCHVLIDYLKRNRNGSELTQILNPKFSTNTFAEEGEEALLDWEISSGDQLYIKFDGTVKGLLAGFKNFYYKANHKFPSFEEWVVIKPEEYKYSSRFEIYQGYIEDIINGEWDNEVHDPALIVPETVDELKRDMTLDSDLREVINKEYSRECGFHHLFNQLVDSPEYWNSIKYINIFKN